MTAIAVPMIICKEEETCDVHAAAEVASTRTLEPLSGLEPPQVHLANRLHAMARNMAVCFQTQTEQFLEAAKSEKSSDGFVHKKLVCVCLAGPGLAYYIPQ